MGLQVTKLHTGGTTSITLTLKDQDGNSISWSGGTLSCMLTPTSGTATATSGAHVSGAIGTVTISASTLSALGLLSASVPYLLNCEARFVTVGSLEYREEFSVPVGVRDGEWVYGLTTLASAREYVGLADNASDAKLIKVLRAASQRIRKLCGKDPDDGFKSRTVTEEIDCNLIGEWFLREQNITAVASIAIRHTTTNSTTIASSTYEITSDAKRIRFFDSFAALFDAGFNVGRGYGLQSRPIDRQPTRKIRFIYTGGFSTVPPDLEHICLELIAQMWSNIGKDRGLQQETLGKYAYVRRSAEEVDRWLRDALLAGGWIRGGVLV